MNGSGQRERGRAAALSRVPRSLCLVFVCSAFLVPRSSFSSDFNLDTDFRNLWLEPNPSGGPYSNYFGVWPSEARTNASTALYQGHALGNTNAVAPSNSAFQLIWSSFGQTAEGFKPDVALGDIIDPPPGANTNVPPANFAAVRVGENAAAYFECQDPVGGAFWVPSTKQVIAAQPNNVEIDWIMTSGATNGIVVFVGAVPTGRPVRLFWTESPYDAPVVSLHGLFPVIHYSSEVTRPVYQTTTNVSGGVTNYSSNVVSGVWVDDQKQLRARNIKGMFILEYYETGTYKEQIRPKGIEVVQVMEPDILFQTADIGARLLPQDSYWSEVEGDADLDADITVGINETAYRFDHAGPKQGWAYAIKKTSDEPWSLEIYWRHTGLMGVLWPFEVDWYSCDWPRHPQLRVISGSTQTTAAVLVPAELTGELMGYMEPALHAALSASGKSLMMTQPGYCLMKYTTYNDIWFEVIQSVSHTDSTYFDLAPTPWDIGEELRPAGEEAHALKFDGTNDYVVAAKSWLDGLADWTLTLWINPSETSFGTLYAEGNEGPTLVLEHSGAGLWFAVWNKNVPGHWVGSTIPAVVASNQWQYLALTLEGGDDTSNGTLRVYLDDRSWTVTNFVREYHGGQAYSYLGADIHWPTYQPTNLFHGRMDEVRIWGRALTEGEIQANQYETQQASQAGLIANYTFDEGTGDTVLNEAGGYHGAVHGGAVWCYGQVDPNTDYAAFPGYIYEPLGNRYNVNRYNYPTEENPEAESYVFAVNTNTLEVWWANPSRQDGMPTVYYPSWVSQYACAWPTGMPEIVIASGLGSNGDQIEDTDDALDFDGVADAVAVPNSPLFQRENELTVEAWFRLDSIAGRRAIVSMVSTGVGAAGFSLGTSDDSLTAVFMDAEHNAQTLTWGTLVTGEWIHAAVTYEVGGVMAGYLGGRLAAQQAAGTLPLNPCDSNLVIGAATAMNVNHLDGRVAEVRVWSVARTAGDIGGLWLSRLQGTEEHLVAYYPFERGVDDAVLLDGGTNNLDGAVLGAAWVQPGRPAPADTVTVLADDSIYYQNDSSRPGYNPNEEHALVLGGVAYALRDDLNTAASSAPFVLVDYLDPDTARPKMSLFGVARTNLQYRFEYPLEAGLPILPPMPLAALPPCANTYSDTEPPAWRDRKDEWWARSAGDDGGTANALMHFSYQIQPGFYFPDLTASNQPAVGAVLPWLPTPSQSNGTTGVPVTVTYAISWPAEVPELKIAQTLTTPTHGLPDIWDQLSVEVVYQQSVQTNAGPSVTLFDPVVEHGANLSNQVVQTMIESDVAARELTSSKVRFPGLPPSLYDRIYYDPDEGSYGQLMIEGQLVQPLTGDAYLLLNLLEEYEQAQAQGVAAGLDTDTVQAWNAAVNALPQGLTLIQPNGPYVNAALYAGLSNGLGYVTLAFNNSTNGQQVPEGLPISLEIIQVVPELYSGAIEVLEPEDVLDEQLTLRASPDFAGQLEDYEFQWRWEEPEGGLIPNTNFATWNAYGADVIPATNEVTIAGASPFTLADHYFAMRYRRIDPTGPAGTNWSDWTYNLAPGWVQRVMDGINPFEQCLENMLANSVDTRATMISLAGAPYEGDIALNLQAACEAGLIPVYRTVLNRAEDFSIRAGISDSGDNETLLFAASKLLDLYMLLGNEAYADAQDPTIAFPRELYEDEHGADATSLFCFMNQMPNLLQEELALLRGRDDTLEPSVETSPIYNRLIWNFTAGINGGEAAYAYSYNIRGSPTSTVGTITAEDAKRLYPQGHGDAWGHYLSALSGYYELLSNTNFAWHTEPGATLLGNAPVSTDFFDEQKFAEGAAAKARTGVEIVNRAYRMAYSEDETVRWPGYRDSNTNRAWGLAGWASRAGQGALYDWAVANSLLLDRLTNMTQVGGADQPPEGIQKIDRTTVPELDEIANGLHQVQVQMDNADRGMNPMGVARDVVPFDISPTDIDEGQTHFEQIYDRAMQALYNACVAFDYARNTTLKMREQFDSVYELQEQLAENETEFHNRLIEIYGYPYPDDIGPSGTYPQGYSGPDLINWQILDLESLVHSAPTGQPMQVTLYDYQFTAGVSWTGVNYEDYLILTNHDPNTYAVAGTTTVYISDSGLKVKPASWTGRRPAQGELQMALSEMIQGWYALEAKLAEYNQTLYELEVEMEHRQADYSRFPNEWSNAVANIAGQKKTAQVIAGLKIASEIANVVAEIVEANAKGAASFSPTVFDGWVGVEDLLGTMSAPREIAYAWADAAKWAKVLVNLGKETGIDSRELQQAQWDADLETLLKNNEYQDILHWGTMETLAKLKEQYVKQAELMEQVQALAQQVEQVRKLLAEGELLLVQRAQVRARAAQRIQMNRYQDLAFRIFRDDGLRRYKDSFDLAARYVYLAAKAYDYETGLLDSDAQLTPGSEFLEDIVKARLPGRFYVWLGEPETGIDEGEPGLADIMARMKADWDVVKGRFGFNNPDTETSRFSLRQECFRISPSAASDGTWAQVLEDHVKEDLRTVPEFKRYCIPFSDSTNAEPALVIPFSTFIVAGKNYFGHDLAGGDNAYDPTHQATKIRSAGIWFTGYNVTFNTNTTGGGLANEPRVYLVPVGQDVMRSPTREGLETRNWKVLDQAMPLPYDVGGMDIDNPDYQPIMDSLAEPLACIRRFASLRAYHDKGQFDEDETHNNGRLVGRSVWNTRWLLIIPGRTLLADPDLAIERFIHGDGSGNGIKDIKIFFQTYSIAGE
ncbi:MAG: hypothetical protein KA248_05800 [Kiritimatiellae bacterium]|nr:hypothetical protein [Kiritimatiellia bacterium]